MFVSSINLWWAIALPVRTIGHQLIGVVVNIISTKMLWELHKCRALTVRSFKQHSKLWAEYRKDGAVWCNLTWWAHKATARTSLFTLFVWTYSVFNHIVILVKGLQGLFYQLHKAQPAAGEPKFSLGSV